MILMVVMCKWVWLGCLYVCNMFWNVWVYRRVMCQCGGVWVNVFWRRVCVCTRHNLCETCLSLYLKREEPCSCIEVLCGWVCYVGVWKLNCTCLCTCVQIKSACMHESTNMPRCRIYQLGWFTNHQINWPLSFITLHSNNYDIILYTLIGTEPLPVR